MKNLKKLSGLTALSALAALPVWAQEAAVDAAAATTEAVAEAAPVMDKGDVAWMMTSTVLVLFMILRVWRCSMVALCAARTCCRS